MDCAEETDKCYRFGGLVNRKCLQSESIAPSRTLSDPVCIKYTVQMIDFVLENDSSEAFYSISHCRYFAHLPTAEIYALL